MYWQQRQQPVGGAKYWAESGQSNRASFLCATGTIQVQASYKSDGALYE